MAPLLIRKAAVVSPLLNRPLVRAAAAVLLLAGFVWAMSNFNLDTSMMGNHPYSCESVKKAQDCPAVRACVRACVRAWPALRVRG